MQRRMIRMFTAVVVCSAMSACFPAVDEPYVERACDVAHPCVDGYVCNHSTSRCEAPDAGGPYDAGVNVIWAQVRDGFDSTRACEGGPCSATVDAAHQNRLTVTVGAPGQVAYGLETSKLTTNATGRLAGTITTPSLLPATANRAAILNLTSATANIVRVSVTREGQVACDSATATLTSNGLNVTTAETPFVTEGKTYKVELAWQQGHQFTVWVDGAQLCNFTVSAYSASVVPKELHLGIEGYEGSATTGFTFVYDNWKLSSDPNATLLP